MTTHNDTYQEAADGFRGIRCRYRIWADNRWQPCMLAKGHWGNHAPKIDDLEDCRR